MNDWVIVAITLFLSALCSGLEIAFNSTNRLQLEVDLKKNKFSAKVVSMFFRNQSFFITSLLIGNNIRNIIYGIAMARILRPVAVWMLPSSLEVEMVILLIQSILGTLLVLVVAEFLPKILFRINPNAILSFFAFPMVVCYYLLYPLTLIYSGIAALIIRVFFRMKMDQRSIRSAPSISMTTSQASRTRARPMRICSRRSSFSRTPWISGWSSFANVWLLGTRSSR